MTELQSWNVALLQMGYTPLHQAAQQGHVVVIKVLLKHKADPNALTAVSVSYMNVGLSGWEFTAFNQLF